MPDADLTLTVGMLTAVVGLMGTVLGAFLAYMFGERSRQRQDQERQQQQAAVARTIIAAELDRNLDGVTRFWHQVKSPDADGNVPEEDSWELALAFVRTPLAPFQRDGFNAQMPALANALTSEKRTALFCQYDRFARLEAIRAELQAALELQEQGQLLGDLSGSIGKMRQSIDQVRETAEKMQPGYRRREVIIANIQVPPFDPFSQTLQATGGEWRKLIDEIISNGNAIGEREK